MTSMVVLAGSVVRMTGSGMGCPDWPKCFGLLIPPTAADQVTWTEGESYEAGRMLIAHDTLWVAQTEMVAADFEQERSAGNWEAYTKHSYATFNPLHTWVEFINRLIGALTGIPALLLIALSFFGGWRYRSWNPFRWSVVHLFFLGLVAWMGKKVVDGNLIPFSITLHMLGAVFILMALALILYSVRQVHWKESRGVQRKAWLILAALLTLIQLIAGTQVREQVDALMHLGIERSDVLDGLPDWWKLHRSGSWVVLTAQLMWIWPQLKIKSPLGGIARWSLGLIVVQMASGIAFVLLAMPAVLQPLHLLLAVGLLLLNFWALLASTNR
jgi:cytochrome c oxidase assembly protein subunit 15